MRRRKHRKPRSLFQYCYAIYKKRIVNINLNVILASIPSFEAAARVSAYLENHSYSHTMIANAAVVTDIVVDLPIRAYLHYLSNKHQFMKKGVFQQKEFWKDFGKVYAASLPAVFLFYGIAGPFQYFLMAGNVFSAEAANRIAYWSTLALTRTVHTIICYKTGLLRNMQEQ